jgi:hypothetical protein
MGNSTKGLCQRNRKLARIRWGLAARHPLLDSLKSYTEKFALSLSWGDLLLLENSWYVTNAGLLRLARRSRCHSIRVRPVTQFCEPTASRFAFEAEVFKSRTCKGFVGYGDADPSNVSPSVHGAEMRIAETRAVNRALRKAYGIGICSVEELGSLSVSPLSSREAKKLPPQPANGSYGGSKVRDQLCRLIRQHQLDPNLVKSYDTDFCGTKTLREATREQVENFVRHLTDWAEKDRNALLCQLNSYLGTKQQEKAKGEGVA